MNLTTRRNFLATTALASSTLATTGVEALAPQILAADLQPLRPIDAHVHVWTSDTQTYPLAEGFSTEAMNPRSFTPEELFAECKPFGVSRIVLIQMSFYRFDNRYMLDAMHRHPGVFSGVAIVDPSKPNVATEMELLAQSGVRGFRLIANLENTSSWDSSKEMGAMWRAGAEQNLAMCLLANPEALENIHKMCARFPETTVVIDHFARIGMTGDFNEQQIDALLALAKYKNVFVKTSAFYALGAKKPPYLDLVPLIRRLRDSFGAERLMWASDCPFQVQNDHSYKASIELVQNQLDFMSSDERRSLLETTAAKVFFT